LGASLLIIMAQLMTAEGAFAQRARTRVPAAPAPSLYAVEGLAVGAKIDPTTPAYRGYQCSPSEQFPDFTRCQRTQKQLYGGTRRSVEVTSATLHGRDGRAVYVNRYLAPWSFERNEIQAELKQLSSKFGEPAREMRPPPHEGFQTAIIATWGKIELTQLDTDAMSILAAGESPRKGLLIDYLGNLRRSAQLGLPVYSINGGAGYLWSASVDRNNLGHIRVLAVDPAALSPAIVESPAAASPATPAAEPPAGDISNIESAATEKLNAEPEPDASVKAEPEAETRVNPEPAKREVQATAAPEQEKITPVLAQVETGLAAAEAKARLLEKLIYWLIGGLIVFLIIAINLLVAWRKNVRATKLQGSTSDGQSSSPAPRTQGQSQARFTEAQRMALQSKPSGKPGNGQPQNVSTNGSSRKQEHQLVAVNSGNNESAEPATTDLISCAQCNGKISRSDKFCMHCGVPVGNTERNTATRPCSSCRQEIGLADKFCRNCGASTMAVASPSMNLTDQSA
jgi:hypothetical protein